MSEKNKKSVVRFCRTAETGNIFYVTAEAVRALNNIGKQDAARELKQRIWKAEDYENALGIISEYVNLVEDK